MNTVKEPAERLAKQIAQQKLSSNLDSPQKDLAQYFYSLNQGLLVSNDKFLDCRGLLLEIACVLSNPAISNLIEEDYYKKNAGNILKRMMDFFDRLEQDEHVQDYLTYLNLHHFSASVTEEEAQQVSKYLS